MTNRTFYVTVDPLQFSGSVKDLARLLVPLVGQPSSALSERLKKGPLRVDRELTHTAAEKIKHRLFAMGITANIAQESDLKNDIEIDFSDLELDLDDIFILDTPSPSITNATPILQKTLPKASSDTLKDSVRGIKDIEIEAEDENPWGALFPNLAPSSPDKSSKKSIPSLGDLEGRPIPMKTPPVRVPSQIQKNTQKQVQKQVPKQVQRQKQAPRTTENMIQDIIPTPLRPPYAPSGFDDAYAHSPELATLFAALAPGAGHRYNGNDKNAYTLILRSIFILPWVRSLTQSKLDATKIQTYYAPRPEVGAIQRALLHIFGFWIFIAILSAGAFLIYHQLQRQAKPVISDAVFSKNQKRDALASAKLKTLEARFVASEAIRIEAEKEPTTEFLMSSDEHTARLYAVGVETCKAQKYNECQAIMSKVNKLEGGYRDAIVLQTWASAQRHAKVKMPMPKIRSVQTLEEIEKSTQKTNPVNSLDSIEK